jgi:hypothetical protein
VVKICSTIKLFINLILGVLKRSLVRPMVLGVRMITASSEHVRLARDQANEVISGKSHDAWRDRISHLIKISSSSLASSQSELKTSVGFNHQYGRENRYCNIGREGGTPMCKSRGRLDKQGGILVAGQGLVLPFRASTKPFLGVGLTRRNHSAGTFPAPR